MLAQSFSVAALLVAFAMAETEVLKPSGQTSKTNLSVGAFDKILLNISVCHLELVSGSPGTVLVSGDSALVPHVLAEVKKGELNMSLDSDVVCPACAPPTLRVPASSLKAFRTGGASRAQVDIAKGVASKEAFELSASGGVLKGEVVTRNLSVSATGYALHATLTGSVSVHLSALAYGASSLLDLSALPPCPSAVAGVFGYASRVALPTVTDDLDASNYGWMGRVTYETPAPQHIVRKGHGYIGPA